MRSEKQIKTRLKLLEHLLQINQENLNVIYALNNIGRHDVEEKESLQRSIRNIGIKIRELKWVLEQ